MPVPVACPFLCLQLEFDLSLLQKYAELPKRNHDAAASEACVQTGLAAEGDVAARGREVPFADIQSMQQQPFDDWCTSSESHVKLDFGYSVSKPPKLCVRVLTDLRHYDGVTAVRLALHTLEAVEGTALSVGENGMLCETMGQVSKSSFPNNPQYLSSRCCRAYNNLLMFIYIALDIVLAPFRCIWNLIVRRTISPNTPEGWNWYYLGRHYEPGEIQIYASISNKYKDFQAKVDEIRQELGLRRGFLYLLNYSPHICCGVVGSASELNMVDRKISKSLAKPGPPILGSGLHMMNMILHRAMMFNNYGRHTHDFEAKPTAFSWDWLNFPGAMSAAFCICINGSFLCGLRGLRGNVDRGAAILAGDAESGGGFGEGRRMLQVAHHPRQNWKGDRRFLQGDAADQSPAEPLPAEEDAHDASTRSGGSSSDCDGI